MDKELPEGLVAEAEAGERKEEVFVLARRAVIWTDVGFPEVAGDPGEVRVDEEAAVDEEGVAALGLGVAGDLSVAYGQVAGFVKLQGVA